MRGIFNALGEAINYVVANFQAFIPARKKTRSWQTNENYVCMC